MKTAEHPPALTRPSWTMRETVVLAVISVVFAFLHLAWIQVWLILQAFIGPLAMDIVMGFWYSSSIFAAYILRKPFAGLVTALLSVTVQILAGNPSGAIMLLTGLVQGAGCEVPLAMTRWKRYSLPVMIACGISTALFSFVYTWFRFSYHQLAPSLVLTMLVIRVISGALLGGVVAWFLARAVVKTGVTAGLTVSRSAGSRVSGD